MGMVQRLLKRLSTAGASVLSAPFVYSGTSSTAYIKVTGWSANERIEDDALKLNGSAPATPITVSAQGVLGGTAHYLSLRRNGVEVANQRAGSSTTTPTVVSWTGIAETTDRFEIWWRKGVTSSRTIAVANSSFGYIIT